MSTPAPTPEEIRQRCEEIQAEWTRAEERRRSMRRYAEMAEPGSYRISSEVEVRD